MVYKQRIKPENGLNDMFSKKWKGRPICNSPEVMPLDTCLFQDVKESVRRHVAMSLTARCSNVKDDRTFSLSSPREASRAYLRVYDPDSGVFPTSKRM